MAEYVIKIELPPEDKKSAVASTGNGSTGTDAADTTSDNSMGKVTNKLKKMVSFAAVKSTADKIANNRINKIALSTGAREYEQRLSFAYNTASQAIGAGAALVGGAVMGGPAGLAVAAITVATSAINKLMEIKQKEETLRLHENLENVSIGMASVRAGTAGRRSKDQ